MSKASDRKLPVSNFILIISIENENSRLDQPIWSVNQLFSLSASQSVNQSVSQSVSQSLSQSVSQSGSQFASQSVGYSVSQSVSQSAIRSISYSVIQSFNYSVNQSFSHSIIQPFSHSIIQSQTIAAHKYKGASFRQIYIVRQIYIILKLILCTVRVVQTSECKFLFCVPFGDIFNSINILTLIINYCRIKFISAHCQPHRGFHNKQQQNDHFTIIEYLMTNYLKRNCLINNNANNYIG